VSLRNQNKSYGALQIIFYVQSREGQLTDLERALKKIRSILS